MVLIDVRHWTKASLFPVFQFPLFPNHPVEYAKALCLQADTPKYKGVILAGIYTEKSEFFNLSQF